MNSEPAPVADAESPQIAPALARAELLRLRLWLSSNWPDLLIVSSLLALFCFVHRRLEAIEIGGDAISKWQFVRQWSYANKFSHAPWDHHKARMGVNAITWLVQRLCGRGWRAYYVGPFCMAALQLPLVYALGKRLAGRFAGVLAAFFVIYLAAVHRSASQLLPDGYAGTYAVAAAYAYARFVEAEQRHAQDWLIATSIAAFVGYLAKETFVFFYPAFLLAGWLARRRLTDVLLMCGIWLSGLTLETLAYRFFTEYSSRLAIIRGTHVGASTSLEDAPSIGLEGLWALYVRLDNDWLCLLGLGLLGAIWLLFFNRTSVKQGRAVALLGISHVAALCISSQIWQRPLPRYMDPAAPFAAVCAAVLFGILLGRTLERWGFWSKYGLAAEPRNAAACTVVIVGIAALLTYRQQSHNPPFDGVAQGAKVARLANDTYNRNLPIACETRASKVLMTVYDVYLSDRSLARARILPDYDKAKRHARRLTYLVKDSRAYDERVFSRLLDAGCVLQLQRGADASRRGYADTKQHEELPAACDGELAAATR